MTAVVEPQQVDVVVPPGSLSVLGVVRTRREWELLEQTLVYYNAAGPNDYSLTWCMDAARVVLSEEEWKRAATDSVAAWLADLDRALSMGCTHYATVDEMKVAARDLILQQRRRMDWCGEGTQSILLQLGLPGIDPEPYERQRFIDHYRQITAAHYGTTEREAWIVRALLRGRAPSTSER